MLHDALLADVSKLNIMGGYSCTHSQCAAIVIQPRSLTPKPHLPFKAAKTSKEGRGNSAAGVSTVFDVGTIQAVQ